MIGEISIRNFKALRSVDLDLPRFCVFIGPNSSGKTSVLEAISLASTLLGDDPETAFVSGTQVRNLCTRGSHDPISLDGRVGIAAFGTCVLDSKSGPVLMSEGWKDSGADNDRWSFVRSLSWKRPLGPREPWNTADPEVTQSVSTKTRTALLRFESQRLAAASYSEKLPHRVESSGAGLSSALLDLKATNDEAFAAIEGQLRAIVPAIKKIKIKRVPVTRTETEVFEVNGERHGFPRERTYAGDKLYFDTVSGEDIPAGQISEGTLILLGLLTVLHSPLNPQIVLIDDLDRGLHPRAQRQLVDQLRTLISQRNELQIIATTHSPYLLSEMRAEEVRVTVLGDDGGVRCAALNEHPDMEKWKAEMSPGEFWSVFGEEWVKDQTHAAHAGDEA